MRTRRMSSGLKLCRLRCQCHSRRRRVSVSYFAVSYRPRPLRFGDSVGIHQYNDNGDNPERRTCTYETLEAARAAHVWSYPSNAEESAGWEVFRDLWEKRYYMGGGSKFCGDWLVYPGACVLWSHSIS